jgi:hypothetical protein
VVDPSLVKSAIQQVLGNKPHPLAPEIKVKDYPAFARAAARMFQQKQPTPQHVSTAYHALTNAEVSPAEFERVWDVAKPLANTLLDRDPTIHDIHMLATKMPGDIHSYYMEHPHPKMPTAKAGDIARYAAIAREPANRYHGRNPVLGELHTFVMGQYSASEVHDHYADNGSGWKQNA